MIPKLDNTNCWICSAWCDWKGFGLIQWHGIRGHCARCGYFPCFVEFMQSCRPGGGGTNAFWWYGKCLLSQTYFRTLCLHGRSFQPCRAFRESTGGYWLGATIRLFAIIMVLFRCLLKMVKCRAWEVGLWAVSKAGWKVCNCIYLHGKHICSCWNVSGSSWDWTSKTKNGSSQDVGGLMPIRMLSIPLLEGI